MVISILIIGIIVILCRWTLVYKEYYVISNKENYVCIEAEVFEEWEYSYDERYIFFSVKNSSEKLDDSYVKIVKESVDKINFSTGEIDIKPGDKIVFYTVLKYFYDGYEYPVVGLKVNDIELIGFDQGYEDLIRDYQKKHRDLIVLGCFLIL